MDNEIYIKLFVVIFPMSIFFTLGLQAIIQLLLRKKRLESVGIIIWGFTSGFIGLVCYPIYIYIANNSQQNYVNEALLGFLIAGGYGMLIFIVINKVRAMKNA